MKKVLSALGTLIQIGGVLFVGSNIAPTVNVFHTTILP